MFNFRAKEIKVQNKVIHIQELSAGGRRAFLKALQKDEKDTYYNLAVMVSQGCTEFKDQTPEQILDLVPEGALTEIAEGITKLSGLASSEKEDDEKKP